MKLIELNSIQDLKLESVEDLFNGKIFGISIKNYLSAANCNSLASRLIDYGFEYYDEPPLGKIGCVCHEENAHRCNVQFHALSWMRDMAPRESATGQFLKQPSAVFV